MAQIRFKRGTLAQINSAAAANQLAQGEPYLITDEARLAVGLSASAFERFAKVSELGSGGPMTYQVGTMSADVTMPSSNVWYDGPSVNLAAGTWLLIAHVTQIRDATTAEHIYARITDGTNHYASAQMYHGSVSGTGVQLTIVGVAVLTGSATIRVQVATSAGSANSKIKAAMAANGSGNNATQIVALKIA